MSTDVITPGKARQADTGRGASRTGAGTRTGPAPDARRPQRPARRPRPGRPVSPAHPWSPVRPASPIRPPGPGRPGRTVRTVGPPRQLDGERAPRRGKVAGAPAAEHARHVGRTSFVMLVLGLLAGGLVCLLMVNTTLAAGSIEINRLEQGNAARTERIQQLQQEVTAQRSPAVIAREARKLGMRPEHVPAFVDLRTGSLRIGDRRAGSGGSAGSDRPAGSGGPRGGTGTARAPKGRAR